MYKDIAQEDQVALNAFMPSQSTDSRFNTLTDLIMQKLDDYEKEGPQVKIQQEPIVRNDKIIDAYTKYIPPRSALFWLLKLYIELDTSCPDTSLVLSQRHSRSFPAFLHGQRS